MTEKVKCVKQPKNSKNVRHNSEYPLIGCFGANNMPVDTFEQATYVVVENEAGKPIRYNKGLFIPVNNEISITYTELLESITLQPHPDNDNRNGGVGIIISSPHFKSEEQSETLSEFNEDSGVAVSTTEYNFSCGVLTIGGTQSLYEEIQDFVNNLSHVLVDNTVVRGNANSFVNNLYKKYITAVVSYLRSSQSAGFVMFSTVEDHPCTSVLQQMSDVFEFISTPRRNWNSSNNILLFVANIGE